MSGMSGMQYNVHATAYDGLKDMYRFEVNEQSSGDIIYFNHEAASYLKYNDVSESVRQDIEDAGYKVVVKHFSCYMLKVKQGPAMALVLIYNNSKNNYEFRITGEKELATALLAIVERKFEGAKHGTLEWCRIEKGSMESSKIVIKNNRKAHSEFYPWLPDDLDSYIDRYLKSESSILLMLGPPGTGKTSFLRHMITSHNLKAVFSYDESLLEDDGFFSKFIVGDSDMMVIEDADLLIGSRENGNKLIPRFLNAAEGLVKMDGKKLVFSTNLESIRNIDEALIRPGRCFDVMKTRLLTHKEMLAVVEAAGLASTPPWKEEYSLAEIFTPAETPRSPQRRVGF